MRRIRTLAILGFILGPLCASQAYAGLIEAQFVAIDIVNADATPQEPTRQFSASDGTFTLDPAGLGGPYLTRGTDAAMDAPRIVLGDDTCCGGIAPLALELQAAGAGLSAADDTAPIEKPPAERMRAMGTLGLLAAVTFAVLGGAFVVFGRRRPQGD